MGQNRMYIAIRHEEVVISRRGKGGRVKIYVRNENVCGAIYVVHIVSVRSDLSTPLPAKTSHPPARNLVCKIS
eukprot:9169289-Pyramimonas_sp.AAC.1